MLCPICYELIEQDKEYITECNHHFCMECLNEWRKKSNLCPMCRGDIDGVIVRHIGEYTFITYNGKVFVIM